MSDKPEPMDKKPITGSGLLNWVLGGTTAIITALWFSEKENKEYQKSLYQEERKAREKAESEKDKAYELVNDCLDKRAERAETAADWARNNVKVGK